MAPERPARPANKARHRRNQATSSQIVGVLGICIAAGVVAALTSSAAPTGSGAIDVFYRAGFVVITTLAGARARRWTLAVGAGLVTLGAVGWWGVAGLAALTITLALAWEGRRHRVAAACAGALIGIAALHLAWPRTTFATAFLAGVATVPMWISAYRTSSRIVRRRIRIAAAVAAAVIVTGVFASALFAVSQRSNVQVAIDEALGAAGQIGSGSGEAPTAGFDTARERLTQVVDAANAPWMVPARFIPVVGTNVNAIRGSAAAGASLAEAAARLSTDVDYRNLHRVGGGIDLAVLRSFQAPLAQADTALAVSEATLRGADSPFLLPPISSRMASLTRRVSAAHHDATTARMGAEVAPGLLGGSGQRRYLVLLGNLAEARDIGGHLGNWAEITADDGHFQVVRVGLPGDLLGGETAGQLLLPDAASFPRSLTEMNPTTYPQNWGATVDMPTVARLAAELYPQTHGGGPLDGVIYADTKAFGAALAITGPIPIPETDLTIDSSDAAAFLERGQYTEFQRQSIGDLAVTALVRKALGRLLEGTLPAPDKVAASFGPAVAQGHLRFVSMHRGDLPFLDRLGLVGAVQPIRGADLLAVVNRNINPSKIDSYLERRIDDAVTFDPATGAVRSDVTITLTNTAPADGLPRVVGNPPPGSPPGTNRTEVAVLSPLAASGAALDGVPTAIGTRTDVHGLARHSVLVDLAPGQTRTLVVRLTGRVSGPDYRLTWIAQPMANDDTATLSVRSTGAPLHDGLRTERRDVANRDQVITVRTGGSV